MLTKKNHRSSLRTNLTVLTASLAFFPLLDTASVYGSGLEPVAIRLGEKIEDLLDLKTILRLGVSLFGSFSAWNVLRDENFATNFITSTQGQKQILCGAILFALTATSIPLTQHITNFFAGFMSYATSKLTEDIFPASLSLLATVTSCCLTSVIVSHAIDSIYEESSGEKKPDKGNVVVTIQK